MSNCTGCGATIPEGVQFCTVCGKPAPAYQQPAPPAYQQPQQYSPQPAPQPAYGGEAPQQPGGPYSVIGTGGFFGLTLLFALPVIGFFACLIMTFAAKNLNIKHYAKSSLIYMIIALVLAIIATIVFSVAAKSIMQAIYDAYSTVGGIA